MLNRVSDETILLSCFSEVEQESTGATVVIISEVKMNDSLQLLQITFNFSAA